MANLEPRVNGVKQDELENPEPRERLENQGEPDHRVHPDLTDSRETEESEAHLEPLDKPHNLVRLHLH